MGKDFTRRKPIGKTYNGLVKALERQAGCVLPMLKRTLGYAKLQSKSGRRARTELEWAMTITAMMGIDSVFQHGIDPARLSPARLIRTLRTFLLRGEVESPLKGHATVAHGLVCNLKDNYRRRRPTKSRHRREARNTPKPLILKPPEIRRATTEEQHLARQYRQQTAAQFTVLPRRGLPARHRGITDSPIAQE